MPGFFFYYKQLEMILNVCNNEFDFMHNAENHIEGKTPWP